MVIGHDHRHNSATFAKLTAAVFLHKGFKVYFFDFLVHTPMVPFAVGYNHAAAGIMITASHNPKCDNGYKLYWENSSQVISPHDKFIQKAILDNQEPWTWDDDLVYSDSKAIILDQSIVDAYFARVRALSSKR